MPPKNPLRLDPTRTTGMRQRFMRELSSHFRQFRKELFELIGKEDALGIKQPNKRTQSLAAVGVATINGSILPRRIVENTRWSFLTDDAKLARFKEWLDNQRNNLDSVMQASTTDYAKQAYEKGLKRALQDTKKLAGGIDTPTRRAFLASAFAAPESLSKIQLLASRSYSNLQGVTRDMETKIQRIMADGLAQKKSFSEIAKELNKQTKLTINRSNTLARTEIMHAHAEGQLDQFERLGEDVGIMAEWSTAGDDRVCPKCLPLEGIVLKVKEARGLIPRHPNCRCTYIPADPDIKEKGQKTSSTSIKKSIKKSRAADGKGKSTFGQKFISTKRKRPVPKRGDKVTAPHVGLFGHSPTGVVRWMGKEGWSFDEAKAALTQSGVDIPDKTIKTALSKGKTGKGSRPAPLTQDQMQILVKRKFEGLRKDPPLPPKPTPPKPPKPTPPKPTPPKPTPPKPPKPTPPPKPKPTPPKPKPTDDVVPDDLWGNAKTSVIRWMGSEGWSIDEVAAFMQNRGIVVSRSTISTALNKGKKGIKLPKFTDEETRLLKLSKGKPIVRPPVEVIPTPVPEVPVDVDVNVPEHIRWTGDSSKVTPLQRKVWNKLNSKPHAEFDVEDYKEVGQIIRKEVEQNPTIATMKRELKETEEFYLGARKKYEVTGDFPEPGDPEHTKLVEARRQMMLLRREFPKKYKEEYHKAVKSIRDFDATDKVRYDVGTQYEKADESLRKLRPSEAKVLDKTIVEAQTYLPDDWCRAVGRQRKLKIEGAARGYYSAARNVIALSGKNQATQMPTAVHEIVHAVERSVVRRNKFGNEKNTFAKLGEDFREYRVSKTKKLKDKKITQIYKNHPDEVGYKDEFQEHYSGKVYSQNKLVDVRYTATEVMTTGIEDFWFDRHMGLWRGDDDYLDFISGVLAGF